jgi:hypothetical protein
VPVMDAAITASTTAVYSALQELFKNGAD